MLLHHRFVETAKRFPTKVGIVDRTTNRRVPYARALIASLMLADRMKQYDPGLIGVMIPTSAGCLLTMLGVLMSGRTPVMINYSTGAASNVDFAQKKCDFTTVITSRALLEKINCRVMPGMVFIEDLMQSLTAVDKVRALLKAKLPISLLKKMIAQGSEDDTLVILLTSGSERDPKAVQLTHRNIRTNVESLTQAFGLGSDDIFLGNLPYFHVFGQTANAWVPIYHGMTVVTYANPLDFKTVCEIVREEKCTLVAGTPSFFFGYLQKSQPGDFASARILLAGADKCPDALRKGFLEKHGKVLLKAYGATETSPAISVNTPENNRPGSVGRVIPGVEVRVENYETGEPCKVGEIGKILVKGPNVMKGYFDDFEQTSLAIRHGYYDTGDMGWMDADGYLWHVGRLKRFMKVGGEMISLPKVEDVLERFLPPETSCCVVEIPDHLRGARIVAAVTRRLDERDVLRKMAEHLPNIALPKHFVVIEELPKMGSGKIDFRKVTELVRDIIHARG